MKCAFVFAGGFRSGDSESRELPIFCGSAFGRRTTDGNIEFALKKSRQLRHFGSIGPPSCLNVLMAELSNVCKFSNLRFGLRLALTVSTRRVLTGTAKWRY